MQFPKRKISQKAVGRKVSEILPVRQVHKVGTIGTLLGKVEFDIVLRLMAKEQGSSSVVSCG